MLSSTRTLLLMTFMIVALNAPAQSERKPSTKATGSISGRVTFDGEPAPGVKVLAFLKGARQDPLASAKTDQSGHFQLDALPSDHYSIVPLAAAHVAAQQTALGWPGQDLSLAEGETIEGVDFALTRGSVITGRIIGDDGQPLAGEPVTLFQVDAQGQKRPWFYSFLPLYGLSTDDRGHYRIFGLPPGRYLVSAGTEQRSLPGRSRQHARTFYPGVTDEAKAEIVELRAGMEATGIDIDLGRTLKTYAVSGRIIDATTGQPIPHAKFSYGKTYEINEPSGGTSSSSSFRMRHYADARGHFRLNGLLPGTFYVSATPEAGSGLYGSMASVEIKDADITGLEIKVRRGASISGVVVVEGANDPAVRTKLARLKLWAFVSAPDIIRGADDQLPGSAVNPDGGFSMTGVRPGKVSLSIGNSEAKGFFLSRVERGGVEHADGFEVRPGEHVAGVRVVLGYASGRIRGQVKIEGGQLPPDAQTDIYFRRVNGPSTQSYPSVQVDPNGRFEIENLLAGEYEVTLSVSRIVEPIGGARRSLAQVSKIVSVTDGAESEVMLVVEWRAPDKD